MTFEGWFFYQCVEKNCYTQIPIWCYFIDIFVWGIITFMLYWFVLRKNIIWGREIEK